MSGPPPPHRTLHPAQRRAVLPGATAAESGATKTLWGSKHPFGARCPMKKVDSIRFASSVGARLGSLFAFFSAPHGFCWAGALCGRSSEHIPLCMGCLCLFFLLLSGRQCLFFPVIHFPPVRRSHIRGRSSCGAGRLSLCGFRNGIICEHWLDGYIAGYGGLRWRGICPLQRSAFRAHWSSFLMLDIGFFLQY